MTVWTRGFGVPPWGAAALRYMVAVASVGLALWLTFLLPEMGGQTPLALFFGAVAVSAWFGGLGPGLLAAALSGVAIQVYFLAPIFEPTLTGFTEVLRLALFTLVALLIGSLSGSLRAAKERAEAARVEAQEARENAAFLAEAGVRLASSLDYEATLQQVARLAVPRMADWCVVDCQEGNAVRLVAVAHVEPAKEDLVRELRRRYPPDPNAPHGLPKVLRTGEPELYPEVRPEWRRAAARDPEHLQLMEALGTRSSMCVPLVAHGEILGALTFVCAESRRSYGADELALAEDLARRCALALHDARLYSRLRETLRTREEFLASLAHDLRNPLAAIQGYAQFLKRQVARGKTPEPPQLLERLGQIEANAARMAVLLRHLLDIARLEAGAPLQLDSRPTDAVALASRVAAAYDQRTDRHRVRAEALESELVGRWDLSRLERVLDNLLGNAVKYSPEGGQVTVRVARQGHEAVIVVSDQGLGIPAEDMPRLFERFYRASNVQDQAQGTGLGLWGARQIVEQHGGSIAVESEVGVGTTVTVRLPLEPPPAAPCTAHEAS